MVVLGGGEDQHRGGADNQKVGGRRAREKVDYVKTGRGRRPKQKALSVVSP